MKALTEQISAFLFLNCILHPPINEQGSLTTSNPTATIPKTIKLSITEYYQIGTKRKFIQIAQEKIYAGLFITYKSSKII